MMKALFLSLMLLFYFGFLMAGLAAHLSENQD